MGRLVIAHHKSYHPYRRDNIERVRRDEEEAREKEAKEEGRMMLADSEARIDRLRERAGLTSKSKKGKEKEEDFVAGPSQTLVSANGHVNLFEDLEQNAIIVSARASKGKNVETKEDDKGVRLAPSTADLNPWYTGKSKQAMEQEPLDDKRLRDMARKSTHDPLTSITHQLASRSSRSSSDLRHAPRRSLPTSSSSATPTELRLSRESSERARAQALIRRKKRESMIGSETPSTAYGGGLEQDKEYGDMFNAREVRQTHQERDRGRDRWRDRGWDDNDKRGFSERGSSRWGRNRSR